MVVFPAADREAANAKAGDDIRVTLELDAGYREVDVPSELAIELDTQGLVEAFSGLSYSKRKEFARQVSDAKTAETKGRRVLKVIEAIRNL